MGRCAPQITQNTYDQKVPLTLVLGGSKQRRLRAVHFSTKQFSQGLKPGVFIFLSHFIKQKNTALRDRLTSSSNISVSIHTLRDVLLQSQTPYSQLLTSSSSISVPIHTLRDVLLQPQTPYKQLLTQIL